MEQCDDITKIFYVIYHELITNKNESIFVRNFDEIIEKHNIKNFVAILNVKRMIYYLKDKFLLAYKLCLLAYIRSDLLKKCSFCYNESIIKLTDKIDNYLEYIKSYNKIKPISSLDNDEFDDDEGKTLNKDSWYYETVDEIHKRLILLTKYFGVDFLSNIGIEKMSNIELNEFNSTQLIKFYNNTIKKITKGLKTIHHYCNALIDVEYTYAKTILSHVPDDDTDEFYIIVTEKTDND